MDVEGTRQAILDHKPRPPSPLSGRKKDPVQMYRVF